MTRRRRLKRRLFWAGVLIGVVLVYAAVSVLRIWVWSRNAARSSFDNGVRATKTPGRKMTPEITFVTGLAVAALALGVLTALGEGRLAGSPEPDRAAYVYVNERTKLANQDARPTTLAGYVDAAERALRVAGAKIAETHSVIRPGDDHVLDPRSVPTPTASARSASAGSDIVWPQLGVGFGLGILLATGMWAALRGMRTALLTH
jgi:hypothetical protein